MKENEHVSIYGRNREVQGAASGQERADHQSTGVLGGLVRPNCLGGRRQFADYGEWERSLSKPVDNAQRWYDSAQLRRDSLVVLSPFATNYWHSLSGRRSGKNSLLLDWLRHNEAYAPDQSRDGSGPRGRSFGLLIHDELEQWSRINEWSIKPVFYPGISAIRGIDWGVGLAPLQGAGSGCAMNTNRDQILQSFEKVDGILCELESRAKGAEQRETRVLAKLEVTQKACTEAERRIAKIYGSLGAGQYAVYPFSGTGEVRVGIADDGVQVSTYTKGPLIYPALQDTNEHLRARLDQTQKDLANAAMQRDEAHRRCDQMANECSVSEARLKTIREKNADLTDRALIISNQKKENDSLMRDAGILSNQVNELQKLKEGDAKTISLLRGECDGLKLTHKQTLSAVNSLREDNQRLYEKWAALHNDVKGPDGLEACNKRQADEITRLRDELAKKQADEIVRLREELAKKQKPVTLSEPRWTTHNPYFYR